MGQDGGIVLSGPGIVGPDIVEPDIFDEKKSTKMHRKLRYQINSSCYTEKQILQLIKFQHIAFASMHDTRFILGFIKNKESE